jgi:hypothetical protein
MFVGNLENSLVAVDILVSHKSDPGAAAEQVRFVQTNRGAVFTTLPRNRELGLQRPQVARFDGEVDYAVLITNGCYLCIE